MKEYVENTNEYHLPFHNYAGPGTHVIERVTGKIKPTTMIDAISLVHDMEYIRDDSTTDADRKMVTSLFTSYPFMPQLAGTAAVAFTANKILGLSKGSNRPDIYNQYKAQAQELLTDYNLYLP